MFTMQSYFDQLVGAMDAKLKQKPTARRRFIREIGHIGQRLYDPKLSVGWTTVFVPFEILHAMDVAGIFIEFAGAMLAGAGIARGYFEKAEGAGYSTDSCSYHRAIIGAAMDGLIPEPEVLIAVNCPCDGGVMAIKRIAEIYKKELFIICNPYSYSAESVDYLVNQYREMIAYITAKTGHAFDIDRLRENIRLCNQGRALLKEALDACKKTPCPSKSDDWKNFIIYALISGTQEGVEVAKIYRDELCEKAAAGFAGVPDEKYRLLWIQNRIQFKNSLIEMLEKEYSANIVFDELNHIYWDEMDERDPLRSLAERQILHPLAGPVERRLDALAQIARDYNIDGAINPSHWGCRQSGGARHLFKETFRKAGVPIIHLDVDCVDERNFSEGQLKTRLQAFMEML